MPIPEMAKLTPCRSDTELVQALTELKSTKAADVTFRNNHVTVANRRMLREHKEREGTKLRVQRFRRNDAVTPPYQGDGIRHKADPDPKRLNDAKNPPGAMGKQVKRSSFNRSYERNLMGRLRDALGEDEMARAGGHWLEDHVRAHPSKVESALAELKVMNETNGLRENPAAWMEDYIKRKESFKHS